MDILKRRFSIGTFATLYDRAIYLAEIFGLRKRRHELLREVSGRVLEIGAGTGLNLVHYPTDIELTVLEPNLEMVEILRSKIGGRDIKVINRGVGDLLSDEFEPNGYDFVVSTLVLCSVPDVEEALRAVAKMLKPGGSFIFIEHVLAPGLYGVVQKTVRPLWAKVADGCQLDRDLLLELDRSPLLATSVIRFNFPLGRPLIPHGIMGTARLRSDFFD